MNSEKMESRRLYAQYKLVAIADCGERLRIHDHNTFSLGGCDKVEEVKFHLARRHQPAHIDAFSSHAPSLSLPFAFIAPRFMVYDAVRVVWLYTSNSWMLGDDGFSSWFLLFVEFFIARDNNFQPYSFILHTHASRRERVCVFVCVSYTRRYNQNRIYRILFCSRRIRFLTLTRSRVMAPTPKYLFYLYAVNVLRDCL